MKSIINKLAKKFGYEIMPAWRMERLELAKHLRELFALHAIDCVLDVGANKGQYHDFLRQEVRYGGLIISFEPIPELNRFLKQRAEQDDVWDVYPYALGSVDTVSSFNITSLNSFSSFLTPDQSGTDEFREMNVVERVEQVEVHQLDSVIGTLRQQHPFVNMYLKMDTQGYDLEVVKGAGNTMPLIRALQTEMSVRQIYKNMPDYITAISMLVERGFDITGFFPVSRDRDLRLIEFDCVMVNHACVASQPGSLKGGL